MRTVIVAFRLNEAEAARLAELARIVDRTPSDVLRRLLAAAEIQRTGVSIGLADGALVNIPRTDDDEDYADFDRDHMGEAPIDKDDE